MTVKLHDAGELSRLDELIQKEKNAKQRDRYRAVLLAAEKCPCDEIAEQIGRCPRFVDKWVARYRSRGIGGLSPQKQPGPKPRLTARQEQKLRERLDAGTTDADGVCTLRGKDICRILKTMPPIQEGAPSSVDLSGFGAG